jgi:hypothetical protein
MAKSIGEALAKGVPIVFTGKGRIPEVVCEPGKEAQALDILEKMDIIKILRPHDGRQPDGTLDVFDENKV